MMNKTFEIKVRNNEIKNVNEAITALSQYNYVYFPLDIDKMADRNGKPMDKNQVSLMVVYDHAKYGVMGIYQVEENGQKYFKTPVFTSYAKAEIFLRSDKVYLTGPNKVPMIGRMPFQEYTKLLLTLNTNCYIEVDGFYKIAFNLAGFKNGYQEFVNSARMAEFCKPQYDAMISHNNDQWVTNVNEFLSLQMESEIAYEKQLKSDFLDGFMEIMFWHHDYLFCLYEPNTNNLLGISIPENENVMTAYIFSNARFAEQCSREIGGRVVCVKKDDFEKLKTQLRNSAEYGLSGYQINHHNKRINIIYRFPEKTEEQKKEDEKLLRQKQIEEQKLVDSINQKIEEERVNEKFYVPKTIEIDKSMLFPKNENGGGFEELVKELSKYTAWYTAIDKGTLIDNKKTPILLNKNMYGSDLEVERKKVKNAFFGEANLITPKGSQISMVRLYNNYDTATMQLRHNMDESELGPNRIPYIGILMTKDLKHIISNWVHTKNVAIIALNNKLYTIKKEDIDEPRIKTNPIIMLYHTDYDKLRMFAEDKEYGYQIKKIRSMLAQEAEKGDVYQGDELYEKIIDLPYVYFRGFANKSIEELIPVFEDQKIFFFFTIPEIAWESNALYKEKADDSVVLELGRENFIRVLLSLHSNGVKYYSIDMIATDEKKILKLSVMGTLKKFKEIYMPKIGKNQLPTA